METGKQQPDRNILVDLKIFNPKLAVGKMEKNLHAQELAASGILVEEGLRVVLKIEGFLESLFKKPAQLIIIAKK